MTQDQARPRANAGFVVGIEHECLTVMEPTAVAKTEPKRKVLGATLTKFFEVLATLAPAQGRGTDLFNSYGRIYMDCGGHVELASIECHSPYVLPIVVETQQGLVRRAVEQSVADGYPRLRLANNNHSGLLESGTATWGSHENYLVSRPPHGFGELILPFLVTRIYGGAGGIWWPSAVFLAASRPLFMEYAAGGGTTANRAVHSTARDESLMSRELSLHRYHLILGDGHRCQFNTALQIGATALALKAIDFDPLLASKAMAAARLRKRGPWLPLLRRFNRLARPSAPPRVNPCVIAIQRTYLDGAGRWADSVDALPEWVPCMLSDWKDTLDAFERQDRAWLAARLDAFAKFELWSAVLAESGSSWKQLVGDRHLFSHLALIDQSYHSFTDPNSVFDVLEANGSLDHRVAPAVVAGAEVEPFVPAVATRAAARARWLVEHAPDERYVMDWQSLFDLKVNQWRRLDDPFATEFTDWSEPTPRPRGREELRRRFEADRIDEELRRRRQVGLS